MNQSGEERRTKKGSMRIRNFVHILAISAALAGYSAWISSRAGKDSSTTTAGDTFPGTDIALLNVADAEALWRKSSTLFVDVRSYPDYEFGHIQGAINLPEEEFDARFTALKPQLEQAGRIVVYCKNVDCGKSYFSALALRQRGFKQVRIYPHGWYEWCQYKLPITGQGS
jgi:rhodanese-related sulfurtransferase